MPSADVTMLGAHSDLWLPSRNRLSRLAEEEGWDRMIPDVRMPDIRLGPVSRQVSEATGLDPGTQVLCGIHDSNASLVPHIVARPPPFTVVSTGTWVITMSVGGRKIELEEARDTLVNVNCLGEPVPSARFMGGREFEMLVPDPDIAAGNDIALDVARCRLAVLPTITEGCGPFPGRPSGRIGIDAEDPARRLVGISYYLAMMSAECVLVTGGDGPVIVEGPMAGNRHFLDLLSVAVPRPVIKRPGGTGTAAGAALLASADRSAAYAISDETHLPDPELAGSAEALCGILARSCSLMLLDWTADALAKIAHSAHEILRKHAEIKPETDRTPIFDIMQNRRCNIHQTSRKHPESFYLPAADLVEKFPSSQSLRHPVQ